MNFFPSRHRHCPACRQRKVKVKDEEVIEYYHQGVVCHLIGFDLALPLDVEMIRPGEGEVVAARRLLERVFAAYGRFFDAVVGDAIYLEGPLFDFCRDHGKDVVAVLKENNPALLADARAIFAMQTPVVVHEGRRTIQVWDTEGFRSSETIAVPLRVLHTEETETKRERIAGQWVTTTKTSRWFWATTLSQRRCPSTVLRQAGHGRWDIENDNFNTLRRDGALNHCFKHDAVAIVNFLLTLFIAFVLVQAFYFRNLKAPVRRIFSTLIAITDELHAELAAAKTHPP